MSRRSFVGLNRSTTAGDFGENFVERERQFRFRKSAGGVGRAKSEVGEVLSAQGGSG